VRVDAGSQPHPAGDEHAVGWGVLVSDQVGAQLAEQVFGWIGVAALGRPGDERDVAHQLWARPERLCAVGIVWVSPQSTFEVVWVDQHADHGDVQHEPQILEHLLVGFGQRDSERLSLPAEGQAAVGHGERRRDRLQDFERDRVGIVGPALPC
jgi:hypothetical protein